MPKTLVALFEDFRGPWLLAILSPLVVSFTRLPLRWDEAFYLHRSVCVARAFWNASPAQIDACLQSMAKSPVMALLLIPGGPPRGDLEGLGVAPFILALATGLAILALARLTAVARIPAPVALLAAVAAVAAPPLRTDAAILFVDGFFAVIVACLAMAPFVEWQAPTPTLASQLRRGAGWALLLTLGMLSKTTFALFVLPIAPAAVAASWLRSGGRATLAKLASATVGSLPLLLVFLRYGDKYYLHASSISFGAAGAFLQLDLSPLQWLGQTLAAVWALLLLTAALAGWAFLRPADRGRVVLAVWLGGFVIGYLALAAITPNKDPFFPYSRFNWPVWLAFPFCAAAAVKASTETALARPGARLVAAILVVALATPMFDHLDWQSLRPALATIERLPARTPASVLLASDERDLNVETLQLARQLQPERYSQLSIGTLAYDIVSNDKPDASIARMAQADYVVGRFPVDPQAPVWTNKFVPAFQAALEASGRPVEILDGARPICIYGRAARP